MNQQRVLLLHGLASCAVTSCGARTGLDYPLYRAGDDVESSDGVLTSTVPGSAPPSRATSDLPPPSDALANSTATSDATSNGSASFTGSSTSEPVTTDPQATTEYTVPFVVVGKSQSESGLYHPLPSDDTLATAVQCLEEGEGLPYPLRYVEWTLVGEQKGELLAVGPADEIYVQPYRTESPHIERYAPGAGWTNRRVRERCDVPHPRVCRRRLRPNRFRRGKPIARLDQCRSIHPPRSLQ